MAMLRAKQTFRARLRGESGVDCCCPFHLTAHMRSTGQLAQACDTSAHMARPPATRGELKGAWSVPAVRPYACIYRAGGTCGASQIAGVYALNQFCRPLSLILSPLHARSLCHSHLPASLSVLCRACVLLAREAYGERTSCFAQVRSSR